MLPVILMMHFVTTPTAQLGCKVGRAGGHVQEMSCDATAAGTTIHAVHALEKAGVRAAFINAVLTAADRSEQLARL